MNKLMSIVTLLFVLSVFAGTAVSGSTAEEQVMIAQPIQSMPDTQASNFTKLEISPRDANFRMSPGESKEITVTIKNRDEKAITVNPELVAMPFSQYMIHKEWVTINPASKEIPAGGSEKFVIKVAVPADAAPGYYNSMIVFTNEIFPTPYSQSPFPNYVHFMSLSIDIWTPPTVQIQNQYINDQLEAGKEYNYTIKLKNTGNKPVAIDPKMSKDNFMYSGPYGSTQAFSDDAITIKAPKEIPADGSAEVNVHINVPAEARGIYRGAIDLGIEDITMRDPWAYRVQLEFGIWTQPTEPYVKTFTAKEATPLSIEVSSNMGMFGYPRPGKNNQKDPSFIVTLTGPDNKEISLKKTKTVIKGGASLGGTMFAPWESESEGIYQEMGTQYMETYTADVQAGDLKLGIMPQNTQQLEYTITMGNN